jgi:CheY-like chemotaxis protein
MFRHALSVAGYAVSETSDGVNALRLIELEPPDMVILDLGLPMLSGLDVQRELASNPQTRNIPVVIVTGSSAELDGLGVECVLRKPISPDDVVDVVKQCFAAHARQKTTS